MGQNVVRLAALLGVSFIALLSLQAYLLWLTYHNQYATLEKEVNASLVSAMEHAQNKRVDSINALFEQDIRNPELATVTLGKNEMQQPVGVILNSKTGGIWLTFQLTEEIDSGDIQEFLYQTLLQKNREFLLEKSIMYWTDSIGKLLDQYVENVSIDGEHLTQYLRQEFAQKRIDAEAHVITHEDSLPPFSRTLLTSDTTYFFEGTEEWAIVGIKNPNRLIFQRSVGVLAASFLVLVLLLISVGWLVRTIRNQRRLVDMKDHFIDNMSHELLTPISTLNLAFETLEKNPDFEQNTYWRVAKQQAERITELTDQILEATMTEHAPESVRRTKLDATPLLRQVVSYQQSTSERPIKTAGFEDLAPHWIQSDAALFTTVLHIVMSNAVKHSEAEKPFIGLSLHQAKAGWLVIDIRDNAVPIPKAERERIFDKFHRVSRPTHEVKGLGIGLFQARKNMELIGGSLCLWQTTPKGNVFRITLPISPTHEG